MRCLLDTHVLFWWLIDRSRLSVRAAAVIRAKANEITVSTASAWEMAIKVGSGKWPEASGLLDNFVSEVAADDFRILPISISHVRAAGLMQSPHRDPFDRLLAAQGQVEGLTLITSDTKLQALGAPWLW